MLPRASFSPLPPAAETSEIPYGQMPAAGSNRCPFPHQRLPVVQQIEHLPALLASRHYRRKLFPHQKIEDRLGIPKVILVPRKCRSSDHSRIADPKLDPDCPRATFQTTTDTLWLPPRPPHPFRICGRTLYRLLVRMKKPLIPDLSIPSLTICYRLFVWMKINSNVYCHC